MANVNSFVSFKCNYRTFPIRTAMSRKLEVRGVWLFHINRQLLILILLVSIAQAQAGTPHVDASTLTLIQDSPHRLLPDKLPPDPRHPVHDCDQPHPPQPSLFQPTPPAPIRARVPEVIGDAKGDDTAEDDYFGDKEYTDDDDDNYAGEDDDNYTDYDFEVDYFVDDLVDDDVGGNMDKTRAHDLPSFFTRDLKTHRTKDWEGERLLLRGKRSLDDSDGSDVNDDKTPISTPRNTKGEGTESGHSKLESSPTQGESDADILSQFRQKRAQFGGLTTEYEELSLNQNPERSVSPESEEAEEGAAFSKQKLEDAPKAKQLLKQKRQEGKLDIVNQLHNAKEDQEYSNPKRAQQTLTAGSSSSQAPDHQDVSQRAAGDTRKSEEILAGQNLQVKPASQHPAGDASHRGDHPLTSAIAPGNSRGTDADDTAPVSKILSRQKRLVPVQSIEQGYSKGVIVSRVKRQNDNWELHLAEAEKNRKVVSRQKRMTPSADDQVTTSNAPLRRKSGISAISKEKDRAGQAEGATSRASPNPDGRGARESKQRDSGFREYATVDSDTGNSEQPRLLSISKLEEMEKELRARMMQEPEHRSYHEDLLLRRMKALREERKQQKKRAEEGGPEATSPPAADVSSSEGWEEELRARRELAQQAVQYGIQRRKERLANPDPNREISVLQRIRQDAEEILRRRLEESRLQRRSLGRAATSPAAGSTGKAAGQARPATRVTDTLHENLGSASADVNQREHGVDAKTSKQKDQGRKKANGDDDFKDEIQEDKDNATDAKTRATIGKKKSDRVLRSLLNLSEKPPRKAMLANASEEAAKINIRLVDPSSSSTADPKTTSDLKRPTSAVDRILQYATARKGPTPHGNKTHVGSSRKKSRVPGLRKKLMEAGHPPGVSLPLRATVMQA